MKPFVSVIVPCRNEARFIKRCLDSILASDYPAHRMEIIVADGMSADGTRELLRKYTDLRLRVLDNPERLTPVALNRAIAASHGEILVRFDAHAVMPPDYLRCTVALLLSSNADNVGGAIRTNAASNGPLSFAIAAALSSTFGVGNSAFRTSSQQSGPHPADTVFAGCWRRELFARIGTFNEKLHRGQDLEFNLRLRRAGGKILLDPSIVCDYYARASLIAFWRHNFSNGTWAVLPFGFSEIVPVRPRHLIPLAFVASLALSPFLSFPWSIAIPALYLAANLTASARIALTQRRAGQLLALPVAFASLHLAYGLGSAYGCLKLAALKLRSPKGPEHATRLET